MDSKKEPLDEKVEYPQVPPYPDIPMPSAPPPTTNNLTAFDVSASKIEPAPTIQQQTVVLQPVAVGPESCRVTCPSCGSSILTRVQYEASTKTHLLALLLCCLGCFLCSCIPYCMDSCQNGNHYCPSCGAYIGTYQS